MLLILSANTIQSSAYTEEQCSVLYCSILLKALSVCMKTVTNYHCHVINDVLYKVIHTWNWEDCRW